MRVHLRSARVLGGNIFFYGVRAHVCVCVSKSQTTVLLNRALSILDDGLAHLGSHGSSADGEASNDEVTNTGIKKTDVITVISTGAHLT